MLLISEKTRNIQFNNVEDFEYNQIISEDIVLEVLFYEDETLIVSIVLDMRVQEQVKKTIELFNKYKVHRPAFVERLTKEAIYGI